MADNHLFDHTQDFSGAEQHRLTQLFPPPDYVKQASDGDKHGDPSVLVDVNYAHPQHRLYPVHTKSATWMSALFFQEHGNKLPWEVGTVVRDRIKRAATFWGIEPDVMRLWDSMTKSASLVESDLPDTAFALIWHDESGHKQRSYPLRNASEVTKAAQWFDAYRSDFVFQDRHKIANNIMRRAAELNVRVEYPSIEKSAGFGYCTAGDIRKAWDHRDRLSRLRYPEFAKKAAELAAMDLTDIVGDAETLHKVASHMADFDVETGLVPQYAHGLRLPEDYLFCLTEGVIRDFADRHVMLPTGDVYEKAALAAIPAHRIRQMLGDELANQLTDGVFSDAEKMAASVNSISAPDADRLMKLAAEFGIEPIGAMHLGPVISDEEISALADRYRQRDVATTAV